MSLLWPAALFVVIGFATVGSADGEGAALWQGLVDNPPTVPQTDERTDAVRALDLFIMQPDSEHAPDLIAYYRGTVDHALHLLETEHVETGMRVFQLYSSAMLVQTPETIFAIDLDQGPNKDLTITPEEEGMPFCLTDEQVARIASLVDYSFHTHQHEDHVDYEITCALMAAGKTVIGTASMKEMWADQPWADRLVVLDQTIDEPQTLGSLQVDVLWDRQWGNNEHTAGTACNAWLITTPDGVSVLAKGDINCGLRLYGWLQLMVRGGRHVDLVVGGPSYWRGVNTAAAINELLTPIWAPGHCWEFTHRPAGEKRGHCQTFLGMYGYAVNQGKTDRAVSLTWGEHLDLPAP